MKGLLLFLFTVAGSTAISGPNPGGCPKSHMLSRATETPHCEIACVISAFPPAPLPKGHDWSAPPPPDTGVWVDTLQYHDALCGYTYVQIPKKSVFEPFMEIQTLRIVEKTCKHKGWLYQYPAPVAVTSAGTMHCLEGYWCALFTDVERAANCKLGRD